MKRAIAYVRVSTGHQELSPEVQAEKLRQFAAFSNFELVEIIFDLAISGRKRFEDRELGRRALELLDSCDAIIFAKLSRGFRNAADALTLVPRLLKAKKDVLFLDVGVSVRTPTGKMVMGMLAVQAEWEADIISERVTEALAEAKRQGKKIGPAPFGSRNLARVVDGKKVDGGKHERIEAESATVERILSLRAQDFTLREIAAVLRHDGVPTRNGGKWHPQTVANVIRRSA